MAGERERETLLIYTINEILHIVACRSISYQTSVGGVHLSLCSKLLKADFNCCLSRAAWMHECATAYMLQGMGGLQ